MIRKSSWIALACSGVLLAAWPAMAHHAVAAQYDMDKQGEWTGTLKKMEFINPHSMLHLEVMAPDGKVTEWVFQTTAVDGRVYATVSAVLLVTALGAALIPARRAARIDPAAMLRAE